jgi:hypothetical protein
MIQPDHCALQMFGAVRAFAAGSNSIWARYRLALRVEQTIAVQQTVIVILGPC